MMSRWPWLLGHQRGETSATACWFDRTTSSCALTGVSPPAATTQNGHASTWGSFAARRTPGVRGPVGDACAPDSTSSPLDDAGGDELLPDDALVDDLDAELLGLGELAG